VRLLPQKFKDRVTVSLRETSELLGVSEKTIYNQLWVGSCPLPTLKFGGRRLIRVADLVQLLDVDARPQSTSAKIEKSSSRH